MIGLTQTEAEATPITTPTTAAAGEGGGMQTKKLGLWSFK